MIQGTKQTTKDEFMLTPEQREKIIEKILNGYSDETLFEKLNLDLYLIFNAELEKKSDLDLVNFIIDDLLD